MGDTSIQWTDKTWNPVTGCSKVSPWCAHCYAEVVADRFWAKQYPVIEIETARPRAFTDVMVHEDRLNQPLRWRKPQRVFVNSMSDLFHEDVPDTFILSVFTAMERAPQHTFQILTKRAKRMKDVVEWVGRKFRDEGDAFPLRNVWLGVSVENQHFADERIPLLLQTPAAVRFISAEPLLGPVDLTSLRGGGWQLRDALNGMGHGSIVSASGMERLDWVIIGGESGPGARPFDLAWARSIIAQCKAAGVSVFVKQLGARPESIPESISYRGSVTPRPDGFYRHLNDRKGGTPDEWPTDLRIREFPEVHA